MCRYSASATVAIPNGRRAVVTTDMPATDEATARAVLHVLAAERLQVPAWKVVVGPITTAA